MRRFLAIAALSLASGILLALPSISPSLRFVALVALIPWIILYDRYEKASIFAILLGSFIFGQIAYRTGFTYKWYIPPFLSLFYVPNFIFFPLFFKRLRRLSIPLCISVPVLWVFFEWVQIHFSLGKFVFFLLGYYFTPDTRFIQIADIGGAYAVSFLVAAVNGLLADIILGWIRNRKENVLFPWKKILFSSSVVLILLAAAFLYGSFRVKDRNWEEGPRIALLQPNILHLPGNNIKVYLSQLLFTEKEVKENEVDLIVWPEYSIKGEVYKDLTILDDLKWLAARKKTPILFGGYGEGKRTKWKKTNSAFLISEEGKITGRYSKLLIFVWGEYVPFDAAMGAISKTAQAFVRRMAMRATGVEPLIEPGDELTLMDLSYGDGESPFSSVICHETIFPEISREAKKKGADFIINMTSEGTCGEYFQRQLLSISIIRAVENKIFMMRDGNTGITAFINPIGEVQSILGKSGSYDKIHGMLKDKVRICHRKTFYARFGDLFAGLCIAITLILFGMTFNRFPLPKKGHSRKTIFLVMSTILMVCCQERSPGDSDFVSHIEKGQEYLRTKDPEKAFKEFVKATKINPDASKAYPFIAQSFNTLELKEAGNEFFSRLKSRGADNPELHFYYGFFKEALADYEEAEKSYLRAIEQKKDYLRAYLRIADMFINRGEGERATEILDKYISRYGEKELVLKYLCRAEIVSRHFAKAEDLAAQLLHIDPKNPEYYLLSGMASFLQGDYQEAEMRLKEGEQLAPDNASIILYLGRVYLRMGRLEELEKQIEKAPAT